jgi:predicted DNA-binding transcriptional regulator AlpA
MQEELFGTAKDRLLTPQEVADWLQVSVDWVWDHSSRKTPHLPVIRLGGGPGRSGLLRFRESRIEEFIAEQESLSNRNRREKPVRMKLPTRSPTENEEHG